jgi:hypothetical protein
MKTIGWMETGLQLSYSWNWVELSGKIIGPHHEDDWMGGDRAVTFLVLVLSGTE